MTRRNGRILDIVAFIFVSWVFAWTLAKIAIPLSPPPLPGERWSNTSFSDFLTLMAGKRFLEQGFLKNYLLDNMTVGYQQFSRGWYAYQVPNLGPNSAIYYTHYGSIDGILNALLRYAGVDRLQTFYRIAAFMSSAALMLWYGAASMLYGRAVGLVSLVFMGTSLIYLRLMETIAAYSYDFLFAFGAIFCFLLAQERPNPSRRRTLLMIGAWLLTLLQAVNSPEFILFLQIFFFGYLWVHSDGPLFKLDPRRRAALRTTLVMMLAPTMAWVLHFLQIAWVLGGPANALRDLARAFDRRTVGFSLAIETPFRDFKLEHAFWFIDQQLTSLLHISLPGAATLLGITYWTSSEMKRDAPADTRDYLSHQWRLLIAMLLAGAAFWIVFPQATVTATPITLRLVLPFAGILLGYSIMMVCKMLTRPNVALLPKVIATLAAITAIFPLIQDRASGKAMDINLQVAPAEYTGRTTNEIRILTDFVRRNTRYGDIILTPIEVGNTGHPHYPHPAYEYLSNRRFEVSKNTSDIVEAVGSFEETRKRLARSDPARGIDYYLLLDSTSQFPSFQHFETCMRVSERTLNTREWWIDHRGAVPALPEGKGERDVTFYLYRLDPARMRHCQDDTAGTLGIQHG